SHLSSAPGTQIKYRSRVTNLPRNGEPRTRLSMGQHC
ncbi:hypothetical protein PSYMO_37469, partial [Pseudomonas amygdali pv. mori str. 301020]